MAASRARRVLCPIDFSDPSRRALRYAAAFAARIDAPLHVLYVNDPLLSTGAAAAGYDEQRLHERTESELRRFVTRTLSRSGVEGRVEYATAVGQAAREIGKHAEKLNAALLVMGTHGLRGPKKLLLGSTTERTLRNTTVPVLAIPHHVKRQPPRGWPGGPLIVGTDLTEFATRDVRMAGALARVLGWELLLVHVLPPVHAPAWVPLRRTQTDPARLAHARTELARVAADLDDVPVSFRVVRGDPAPTLARVARSTKAGTLMLVLRRGAGVLGMARGTVTYHALATAVTPVLAMPDTLTAARLVRDWSV